MQGMIADEDRLAGVVVQRILHRTAVLAVRPHRLVVLPGIDQAHRSVVVEQEMAVRQQRRGVLAAEFPLGIIDRDERRRAEFA